MAVVYQSSQTASTGTSGSITVTAPTGIQQNDLLIAHLAINQTVNTPTGWTSYYQANTLAVFYKLASSSEPTSYVFTFSASGAGSAAVIRLSGTDLTNPLNNSIAAYNPSSASSLSTGAGLAPTVTNTLLLFLTRQNSTVTASSYSTSNTSPTYTQRYNLSNATSSISAATAPYAPATDTVNNTANFSSSTILTEIVIALAPFLPVTVVATAVNIPVGITVKSKLLKLVTAVPIFITVGTATGGLIIKKVVNAVKGVASIVVNAIKP